METLKRCPTTTYDIATAAGNMERGNYDTAAWKSTKRMEKVRALRKTTTMR